MSYKIIALLLITLSANCSADYSSWMPDCDKTTTSVRAKFTLQCISNANPKSDEEPEDWIRICKNMADEFYCPMAMFLVYTTSNGTRQKIVKQKEGAEPE